MFLGVRTPHTYALMPVGHNFMSLHITSYTQKQLHVQHSIRHQFNGLSETVQ
jgi:hypothetical protein